MWIDGVVGKRVYLTGLIPGQTEGPQFEPESMHKADIRLNWEICHIVTVSQFLFVTQSAVVYCPRRLTVSDKYTNRVIQKRQIQNEIGLPTRSV